MNKVEIRNLNIGLQSFSDVYRVLREQLLFSEGAVAIIAGHYKTDREGNSLFRAGLTTKIRVDGNPDFKFHPHSYGIFPETTLRLGLDLVDYAVEKKRKVKLVALVDDCSETDYFSWLPNAEESENKKKIDAAFKKNPVDPLYVSMIENKSYSKNYDESLLARSLNNKLSFRFSDFRQLALTKGLLLGDFLEYASVLKHLKYSGFKGVISLLPYINRFYSKFATEHYFEQNSHSDLRVVHAHFSTHPSLSTSKELMDRTIRSCGGVDVDRFMKSD